MGAAILTVATLACVGFLTLVQSVPPDPVYEGKRESAWLTELELGDGDDDPRVPAVRAFRNMGTNALPQLLSIIDGRNPLPRLVMKLNSFQSLVKLPGGEPWLKETAAAFAIRAIGSNAHTAIGALSNMIFLTDASITSAVALGGIGSEAAAPLLMATTNRNPRIRLAGLSGLGMEHTKLDQIVPAVVNCLADSDHTVRVEAIICLGELHAIPDLAVPRLATELSDTDTLARLAALVALGKFGTNARPAVPKILEACKDSDPDVRSAAQSVLGDIDPQ